MMFSVLGVDIYSFGVLLLIGVLYGMFVAWKKASENHIDDEFFMQASITTLFWALVGSRLVYVAEHFGDFGGNLMKWLWITRYTGLSMWGAIAGGAAGLFYFAKDEDKDGYELMDWAAIGAAVTIGIGRIGSLLNGSSAGIESSWGVMMGDEKRLPVQLVEAILFGLLAAALWRMERKYRTYEWYRAGKSGAKSGFLSGAFLIGAGVIVLISGFVRDEETVFLGLKLIQWMAMAAIAAGGAILYYRSGRDVAEDLRFKKQKREAVI